MLNQGEQDEVIVVDYGCPDGTADWIESQQNPRLKAVRVTRDTDEFSRSRARNIGIRESSHSYVATVDADVIIPIGYVDRFMREIEWNQWILACAAVNGATNGHCVIKRAAWEQVRGYDEQMTGWGYEDGDLYQRIRKAGLATGLVENCRATHLPHSEADSQQFHRQTRHQSAIRNGKRMQDVGRVVNPDGYGQR